MDQLDVNSANNEARVTIALEEVATFLEQSVVGSTTASANLAILNIFPNPTREQIAVTIKNRT